MNHITTLSATGLKSGDFSHDLSPVTLLCGPSASGKTARLDAIRLALCGATILGRAGELKGQRTAIMDLARNGTLAVSATDSQGRTNSRRWTRKETKEECQIPAFTGIAFDSGEYFRLSDAKKLEYVFGLYKMAESTEFSPEAVIACLRNIKLPENTAATETVIRSLVETADDSDRERHETDGSIQDWIGGLITSFKERLSTAKANADRMTKLVQGITQISADENAGRNPEPALKAAREQAAALMVARGKITAALEQLERLEAQRTTIARKITELDEAKRLLNVATLQAEIVSLEEALKDLEGKNTAQTAWAQNGVDAARKTHDASQQAYADAIGQNKPRAVKESVRFSGLMRDLAQIEKDMTAVNLRMAQIQGQECCVHCGAKPEHWDAEHSKESALEVKRNELAELRAARESTAQEIEKAQLALAESEAQEKQSALRVADAAQAMKEASEVQQKAVNDMLKISREFQYMRADLQSKLDAAKARLTGFSTLASNRQSLEAQLAELTDQIAKADRPALQAQAEGARNALAGLEQRIATLETAKQEFTRAKADEQRNAVALLEHAKAKADVDVTKAAIEALEELQSRMVQAAFGSILKTVNRITGAVMPEPIEYRDGELGRFVKATWISHECFSGTEKALTYAGISLALSADAPVRIVLLDEAGRLDQDALYKLLERMQALVAAGELDQFIGCLSTKLDAWVPQGVAITKV